MFNEKQLYKFQALNQWFISSQGLLVATAFQHELSFLSDILYGDVLLQLGQCGTNLWLPHFHFKSNWIAAPYTGKGMTITTLINQLPINRDSVDCILAPLTLEAFNNHTMIIDEMDRVLKSMGYIIFIGVNPYSLWSLWLKYAQQTCYAAEKGKPKSIYTLKRAMHHRGYRQCYLNNFYYTPPFSKKHLIAQWRVLNEIGKMISFMPAAFYCLVMQKQVKNYIGPLDLSLNNQVMNGNTTAYQPACCTSSNKFQVYK